MRNLFIIVSIILIFSACRRERNYNTSVSGKVIDQEDGSVIPGAHVYVLKEKLSNPGIFVHIEEAITNSNGQFYIDFPGNNEYRYYTYATYENYLMNGFILTYVGQLNNINPLLSKPGFLSLHLVNNNPYDSTDLIKIIDSDYWTPVFQFSGMTIDTTIILQHYSSRMNTIKWQITRQDSTIYYDSTIYFQAFDTLQMDLYY